MKTYTLTTPLRVGSLDSGITLNALQLSAISLNFSPDRQASGKVVLSVVLVHPASGYQVNIVYEDASALLFWNTWQPTLEAAVFAKLQADAKLPPGVLT